MDRLQVATGTAEVLAALRRSLDAGTVTAPLPAAEPERSRTSAMLAAGSHTIVAGPDDLAAVVATSGSTGHPRGVLLSGSALIASAEATHRRLGGPGRWVLALPVHYVAGLMVLVRSLVAGTSVHEVDRGLTALPELATDLALDTDVPAYLSLVPTQLVRALDRPEQVDALRRFAVVLLGGAAADPALLERARTAGVQVVTTYGMSETCGGCVYDGVPLDGVQVSLEPGTDRIRLAGPMLFSGYLAAEPFREDWFGTGDRGTWVDGRLQVVGRLDAVVTSGGHKVDLDAVERALRRRSDADIAVLGVPDAEWGTRVVAVGAGLADDLAAQLGAVLAEDVPRYAIPRQWIALPVLPRTAGGKIDRQRLIRELTERGGA